MPYALCPTPYALCPMHVGYLMLLRKAIADVRGCTRMNVDLDLRAIALFYLMAIAQIANSTPKGYQVLKFNSQKPV
ncbi:MAG: hypothetical protein WBL95_01085 [Microcoleus sp.]